MVFAMRSEILCKIICPNILISSYGNFEIPSSRIFDGGISGFKNGFGIDREGEEGYNREELLQKCYTNIMIG